MVGKSDVNMGTLAKPEEAFPLASSKFKFADLDCQKLAIQKTVAEKDDNLPCVYTLFRLISIARYVFKSSSICYFFLSGEHCVTS